MIICRTPVRISLGGGGTDLASYYSQFGGFLVAAAINKYIHICCSKRFSEQIRLSYSKTEIVNSISEIEHKIFKECLNFTKIDKQIEIVSMADIPANCGLGTSSSFTVSLLNALYTYKRMFISKYDLAEKACEIEIEKLKEPIGKQDQYISTFGGITAFTFNKDGSVIVEPIKMKEEDVEELNNNTLLFYTGVERSASGILRKQNEFSKRKVEDVLCRLHRIKEMGYESRAALESGNIDRFGEILHKHWLTKKGLNSDISLGLVDEAYEEARRLGALGGKLIGAGGGGFLMVYCSKNRRNIIKALNGIGLKYMQYNFDFDGSKIISNHR